MYIELLTNANLHLLPMICETSFDYYRDYWKEYRNIHSAKEVEIYFKQTFVDKYNYNHTESTNKNYNNLYIIFSYIPDSLHATQNEIIGFGSTIDNDFKHYKKKDANGLFLSDLFIFNKYRNKGYATQVMKSIIDILLKDKKTIYISVADDPILLEFYKKRGFVIIDKYVAESDYFIFEYIGTSKI